MSLSIGLFFFFFGQRGEWQPASNEEETFISCSASVIRQCDRSLGATQENMNMHLSSLVFSTAFLSCPVYTWWPQFRAPVVHFCRQQVFNSFCLLQWAKRMRGTDCSIHILFCLSHQLCSHSCLVSQIPEPFWNFLTLNHLASFWFPLSSLWFQRFLPSESVMQLSFLIFKNINILKFIVFYLCVCVCVWVSALLSFYWSFERGWKYGLNLLCLTRNLLVFFPY